MSCNAFNLYGLACGMGGKASGYIPREIQPVMQYISQSGEHYEDTTSYRLTPVKEANTWKPVPLYLPSPLPAARDLGFSYHPTLDIALSYLSKRNEKNNNTASEPITPPGPRLQTSHPRPFAPSPRLQTPDLSSQTICSQPQTPDSRPLTPDHLPPTPAWEQERQELEQLIAQEKKVQHHAAS